MINIKNQNRNIKSKNKKLIVMPAGSHRDAVKLIYIYISLFLNLFVTL